MHMKKSQKKVLAVGAGAAAVAAAAAGIYFLTGKQGTKNRKKIGTWAAKAKREVISELKGLKNISQSTYHQAVDTVARRYKGLKNIDAAELAAVAQELKGHWDTISKQIKPSAKTSPKNKIKKK